MPAEGHQHKPRTDLGPEMLPLDPVTVVLDCRPVGRGVELFQCVLDQLPLVAQHPPIGPLEDDGILEFLMANEVTLEEPGFHLTAELSANRRAAMGTEG